ncbi:MAG: TIGR03000 domain-containing protein [Thermoguttaceae bacterium]|nr:TIGR03000 domain-containing protein [Planctomycetaceae bacterium]MBQ4142964.1 TIGR03000 domain-containing protein [Thermoguttaceae bacterium]
MNKALKFAVMAFVMLSVWSMSQTASAWWGHVGYWGGPFWGPRAFAYPSVYSYGYYGYGWADPCCAPVVEPCCAPVAAPVVAPVAAAPVVAEPVCDVCGPVYAGGSYVLGWRPGPIRRLLFGRYRWYATSYFGGYYYTPDYCCETDAVIQETATPAAVPAEPAEKAVPSVVTPDENSASILNTPFHQASFTQEEAVPANSGILTISVPHDAVVYVNDNLTAATGSTRSFVSYGLEAGNAYDYVIRAEVTLNGQKFVETKVVTLKAGDRSNVAFQFIGTNVGNQTVSL